MQILPTVESKVYKYYLLWAIWSLGVRVGVRVSEFLQVLLRGSFYKGLEEV